jgi:putative transposase
LPVDFALTGQSVVDALQGVRRTHGLLTATSVDHGTEFTSKVLDERGYQNGVRLDFIRPCKPNQNVCVESFNGRLCDECLNEHWFTSLAHARAVIETWRCEYNNERQQDHYLPCAFSRAENSQVDRGLDVAFST